MSGRVLSMSGSAAGERNRDQGRPQSNLQTKVIF